MANIIWIVLSMIVLSMIVVVFLVQKKQAIATKLALVLSIFLVISIGYVYVSSDAKVGNVGEFFDFVGVYFSWLGSTFNNVLTITTQAINTDWGPDIGRSANNTAAAR